MDNQEDISKVSSEQGDAIAKDIEKLAPLKVQKPNTTKEGVQSSGKITAFETFKELSPSIRDYITNYITLADAKSGVLLGVLTALLSLTFFEARESLKIPFNQWNIVEYIILCCCILFVLGIGSALLVVWPRALTSKQKGFVSWVHISNYNTVDDYLKDILSSKESQLSEQICELNYDLSHVCRKKYLWLSRAFKFGLVAGVLLLFILARQFL